MVEKRDGDDIGCVYVCGGSEGDETVHGSGAREAVIKIRPGVDSGPGVCAGCVDVERGWCPVCYLWQLYACKAYVCCEDELEGR